MGASFLHEIIPGTATKEDVQKRFEGLVAQGEYEDGHSYSGNWNMVHLLTFEPAGSSPFSCQAEAENYVLKKSRKWENAHAVQFFNPEPGLLKLPKKYDNVYARLKELIAPGWESGPHTSDADLQLYVQSRFNTELLARVKGAKSQFRGCGACGSRISVKHLHNLNCPVCHHAFIVTDTDRKVLSTKLLKAQSLVKELNTLYTQAQEKQKHNLLKNPANLQWYLGAWCAS